MALNKLVSLSSLFFVISRSSMVVEQLSFFTCFYEPGGRPTHVACRCLCPFWNKSQKWREKRVVGIGYGIKCSHLIVQTCFRKFLRSAFMIWQWQCTSPPHQKNRSKKKFQHISEQSKLDRKNELLRHFCSGHLTKLCRISYVFEGAASSGSDERSSTV